MKNFARYLSRNPQVVLPDFSTNLPLIVVIPVLDDPEIFQTLDSLLATRPLAERFGILVVVNHSEHATEELKHRNHILAEGIRTYAGRIVGKVELKVLEAFDLPAREAGVGLARKLGLDAAANYFYVRNRPDGVMASLDADTFVSCNYVEALLDCFTQTNRSGVSISYSHRLGDVAPEDRQAIVSYELYLRYYCHALQYAGHPYAYYTIGSAFAVRASDYVAVGGMNKRQAGEDFYFIQKLIAGGRYGALNTACVYPSSRMSERTPFGTGQAVKQIRENGGRWLVYAMDAFKDLRAFFGVLDALYKATPEESQRIWEQLAEPLRNFFPLADFVSVWVEIDGNTSSYSQFRKRFFDRFNAFWVLKFLNFSHTSFYSRLPVGEASRHLLLMCGSPSAIAEEEMLMVFRNLDGVKEADQYISSMSLIDPR